MKNSQIKPLISLAGAFYLRGVSKVAKGNFGCTAAPLNREQKGRSLFVFHLACLLTALLLALPHCSSDDNGSGGGGGSDEDSPPADAPPAALSAIYLWVTDCTVQGDMNGGDCPALPAGAPTNGPERADAICANQYESDVSADSRDRIIADEGLRHTVLLARSNNLPREVFPVRGKDTLEIKRPDETLIADSWDQFFDPGATIGDTVTGSLSDEYWTGWWVEADNFSPATSSGNQFYCGSSGSYWINNTDGGSGDERGSIASGGVSSSSRLYNTIIDVNCDDLFKILCITH